MQVNEYNKLKHLSVTFTTFNDEQQTLISHKIKNEFIESFQIDYGSSIAVKASMLITDSDMLGQLVQFKEQFVDIDFLDYFEERTQIKFRILSVNHIDYSAKQKAYEMLLQDVQSYNLSNSFLGKSYPKGSDLVHIINEFLEYTSVDTNKWRVHGSIPLQGNFIVPKHLNNLDFFENEIFRLGYNVCAERFGQTVRSDLEMRENLYHTEPFVESETNQNYKNRIHAQHIKELMRDKQEPLYETFRFDPLFKSVESQNYGNIEIFSYNEIKDNTVETFGRKPVYERLSSHIERLRRNSLKSYGIDIVVSGYSFRRVNETQEVYLQGNKTHRESLRYGDTVNSGVYLIQQIQDKYVQGSLLQKVFLRRPDTGKVLNPEAI